MAADTAAVMVTHNGSRYVRGQFESIFCQTVLPAVVSVVDDASSDGTADILREIAGLAPVPVEITTVDSSSVGDVKTRIARNVTKALATVAEYDFVLLADQDDEWLDNRLATQREVLRGAREALLVAGDGLIIDETGTLTGSTLREIFPIPEHWDALDERARMHAALRRPLVTGAACALRSEIVALMASMPRGWLHDRWASLVAAARGGLVLQQERVIRYRVHPDQVVGGAHVRRGAGKRRWRQALARGARPVEAAARAADAVIRLRPLAVDDGVRAELSWRAVLGSALDVG